MFITRVRIRQYDNAVERWI